MPYSNYTDFYFEGKRIVRKVPEGIKNKRSATDNYLTESGFQLAGFHLISGEGKLQ